MLGALLLWLVFASTAHAQDAWSDHFRILWGIHMGALGKTSVFDASSSPGFERQKLTVDPSYGMQFGFGWYSEWVALDAQLAFHMLRLHYDADNPYSDETQGALFELGVSPRLHHRLGRLPLEAHAAVSLAAAFPGLSLLNGNYHVDRGLTVGAGLGLTYFFASRFGAELETGIKTTRLGLRAPGPQDSLSWTQWNVFTLRLVATF